MTSVVDPTALLAQVKAELAEVDRDIARLAARRDALREMAEGLERGLMMLKQLEEGTTPTPPQSPSAAEDPAIELPSRGPRGSTAILRILQDGPRGATWTLDELLAEQTRRGWTPRSDSPLLAVRAAVNRLRKDRVVDRLEDGRYRLVLSAPLTDTAAHSNAGEEVSP